MLKDCLNKAECDIVFYKLDGCPHCVKMKEKLDALGLPYLIKDANQQVIEMTGIETAPQVHIITKDEIHVLTKLSEIDELI